MAHNKNRCAIFYSCCSWFPCEAKAETRACAPKRSRPGAFFTLPWRPLITRPVPHLLLCSGAPPARALLLAGTRCRERAENSNFLSTAAAFRQAPIKRSKKWLFERHLSAYRGLTPDNGTLVAGKYVARAPLTQARCSAYAHANAHDCLLPINARRCRDADNVNACRRHFTPMVDLPPAIGKCAPFVREPGAAAAWVAFSAMRVSAAAQREMGTAMQIEHVLCIRFQHSMGHGDFPMAGAMPTYLISYSA